MYRKRSLTGIKGVPANKQREEGLKIAIETIQALKGVEGVHGVHIMAIEWEEARTADCRGGRAYPRPALFEEE